MTQTGYSKTPLSKKLGIKEGFKILLINQPNHYLSLFDDLPEVTELHQARVQTADFIHLFCTTMKSFEKESLKCKKVLKKDGILWVSWPKGSSGIQTDLKRDPIRKFLLNNGLVDVKVCAVDEDWSGLKFVYRIEDRKNM